MSKLRVARKKAKEIELLSMMKNSPRLCQKEKKLLIILMNKHRSAKFISEVDQWF